MLKIVCHQLIYYFLNLEIDFRILFMAMIRYLTQDILTLNEKLWLSNRRDIRAKKQQGGRPLMTSQP